MELKEIVKSKIPSFARMVSSIRKPVHYFKSYSQCGEDMVIRAIVGDKKNGFYVDVGAHHPTKYSNTFYFYKLGWRGINIDPLPDIMGTFKKVRPRDINLELAVSDSPETLDYYMFNDPAVNTFSPELARERNGVGTYKMTGTKKIQTERLEEILDKNLPQKTEIDFLTIDAEGFDFKILKSNNWNKYRPDVVVLEISRTDKNNSGQKSETENFLKSKGYELYSRAGDSFIFTKICQ